MSAELFCILLGSGGGAHVEANNDINKLNDRLAEIYQELSEK